MFGLPIMRTSVPLDLRVLLRVSGDARSGKAQSSIHSPSGSQCSGRRTRPADLQGCGISSPRIGILRLGESPSKSARPYNGSSHNLQDPLERVWWRVVGRRQTARADSVIRSSFPSRWRRTRLPARQNPVWFRGLLYGGGAPSLLERFEHGVKSNFTRNGLKRVGLDF